ncbi:MAG: glycoside hydrolase family 3 N-terminal domain-containing protein [Bacteroidia bacterium]|nr:glycoside hydrolase family 3 N-terminal domain-containing protein [Bacteroidia bacterium]
MNKRPTFLAYLHHDWVNQQLNRLSLSEKIAQLIHVATWSNREESHYREIENLIREYGIGGLTFFQGDPLTQATLTNRYQSASSLPLMISLDAEWGLAMRLNETVRFPYQMALGAVQDNSLIYEMGREIGRQCRRLGVHVNFAPDVDINTHPDNPVIGFRSFGSDREAVFQKAKAYMKGMQEENVMAVAKHFPGHGDTHADSHFTLPILKHSRQRLEEIELYPYRQLIPEGIDGVMTSHLHVPTLDPDPGSVASLSPRIIQDLLMQQMGFEGLIFTDALDMKGVAAFRTPAEVNLQAFLAGNDALVFCTDVKGSIEKIKETVIAGTINEVEIERRCRKILAAKYALGLNDYQPVSLTGLAEDLNNAHAEKLNKKLAEESLTFYPSAPTPSPLKPGEKTASLAIFAQKEQSEKNLIHHGFQRTNERIQAEGQTLFQQILTQYGVESFIIGHSPDEKEIKEIHLQLEKYDHLIVSLHDMQIKAVHGFGITPNIIQLVEKLADSGKVRLVVFGSAYSLRKFKLPADRCSVLLAYQETPFTQTAAAEILAGKNFAKGQIPVVINH